MKKTILLPFFLVLMIATAAQQQILKVNADGKGGYSSIQAAIDAIPAGNQTPVTIHVSPGVYKERVVLPEGKDHVTIEGENAATTLITFNNHTGTVLPGGDTINTWTSATFFIYASDFTANNVSFENNAGMTAGQAVAVFANGDRLMFNNCRFLGFQDVLFCSGINSRQYYRNCYIEGSTDFIFGASTVVFDHCQIHSKKNSHVTAASTPQDKPYGFVFLDCRLTADTGITKVSLGRPWRPYSAVAYLRCEIGAHIVPEGWNNWKNQENEKTARYAEYRNTGPGAALNQRVSWVRQLTEKEAAGYTALNILGSWIKNGSVKK
ncbi:pectinesterase family protein [Sediminibacterium ginsengisoli]|uniref:Pectinesterase n=1 Tax=Sediminibacterium ginsengisoli TaxID=413434 RepID=A0A1T4K2L4_9BACT|nr:pectinesterase family protein [Sediminibacterium ginsengisoli]SJZ36648.1 pectinesterase [Sediminibacterium ginsengisoli]